MKESYSPRAALPLVFCTFIFSCSILQENRISEELLDNFPVPDGRSFGLVISYEVESLSFSEFSGGDPPRELALQSEPAVSRSKIKTVIYKDGSSDWLIKNVKPRNPPVEFHNIPKSDYDEISTIRIINNQGYFINGNGDLIHKQRIDVPSFAELILDVQNSNNKNINARVSEVLSETIFLSEQRLSELREINLVEELPSGLIKIKDLELYNKNFNSRTQEEELIYETYGDPITGLVVGGKVLNQNGELISYVVYKYSEAGMGSILEMIHYKEFHPGDDEGTEVGILNNYFENIVIENHLN